MPTKIEQHAEIVLPIDIYHTDREAYIEKIKHFIGMDINDIVIECMHLRTISSSHVSLMWEVYLLCQKHNINLKIQNVADPIREVLRVLDISDFFPVVNQEEYHSPVLDTNRITSITLPPLRFELSPTTEDIVRCKFSIGNHLKDAYIPYIIVYEIETIFYEVVTNIRLHGVYNDSGTISVEINQVNNTIIMVIMDNCQSFDPTKRVSEYNPETAIKQGMKNGLGIIMVKKMSDSLTYTRKDNKNILTVKKSWSS